MGSGVTAARIMKQLHPQTPNMLNELASGKPLSTAVPPPPPLTVKPQITKFATAHNFKYPPRFGPIWPCAS